ncbi:MAG TPA: response regulator [Polyangiales bacterium]|jgi:DNA-binding response OmpR family regulator|nr:response regulator [Polyangiales bacterium]
MRVLVVDDEELVVHLLRRYLQKWGHEAVCATDGSEAWEQFQKEPVPMVITDWMMPRMTGLDLIRKIRAHAQGGSVYAVVLTGRAAKEDVVTGMEAGADDFLAKPFDKDELRVRVREGERIVELERARADAEARCTALRQHVARGTESVEQDLARAIGLLGKLNGSAPAECAEALAQLTNAREGLAALGRAAT